MMNNKNFIFKIIKIVMKQIIKLLILKFLKKLNKAKLITLIILKLPNKLKKAKLITLII